MKVMSFEKQLSIESPTLGRLWVLLSFQAGAINAIGFLACHRFVSHVTGFATYAGIDGAYGEWSLALSMLAVPFFFIAGAMLSGFLVERRRRQGLPAHYSIASGFILLWLCGLWALGAGHHFGDFGASDSSTARYGLLAALSFICGFQNALFTMASGNVVRTTHLTGIATDIGISFTNLLTLRSSSDQRRKEFRAVALRFLSMASFAVGSLAAAVLAVTFGYQALALPFLSALIFFIYSYRFKIRTEG